MTGASFISASAGRPAKREWIALFILLGSVFLLNVLTYALYPSVWNDDILWTEPSINLVRTGHFTTSVWQLEPANTFWAAQSPLYPLILSLWLRLAGFSLLAVRSFNFLLITVAGFMVWFGSWKCELVKRPSVRMLAVGLVLFGYGISFAYRSSRPDICGLISLLSLGLAFQTRNPRRKNLLIFLCAAIAPWVGVQVGLYACCAVFLAKIIFRNVLWREVLLVWAAVGLGVGGLLSFYASKGVLAYFMASLNQAANEHLTWGGNQSYLSSIPRRIRFSCLSYIQDFSALPLIGGLAAVWFVMRRFGSRSRVICYFLGLFFIIPLIFNFTGHFAFYYSYMLFVPLVLAFCVACSTVLETGAPNFLGRAVLPVCVAGSVAVGLPLRLALCGLFYQSTPRNVCYQIIQKHVRPQDVVFCDYTAFFETKLCARQVFIPAYSTNFVTISTHGHGFSAQEKKDITVLIIPPDKIANMQGYFGGDWKPVSEPFGDSLSLDEIVKTPVFGPRIQHHFSTPQMLRQKLQIFRRDEGTELTQPDVARDRTEKGGI